MKTLLKRALLIAMASASLLAQDPPDVEALKKGQPKDVASFISRAFGCAHFAGEEPYSQARAREIKDAMRRLKCDQLGNDEEQLRRKYRKQPSVLKALDAIKAMDQ